MLDLYDSFSPIHILANSRTLSIIWLRLQSIHVSCLSYRPIARPLSTSLYIDGRPHRHYHSQLTCCYLLLRMSSPLWRASAVILSLFSILYGPGFRSPGRHLLNMGARAGKAYCFKEPICSFSSLMIPNRRLKGAWVCSTGTLL